jgi:hypothetical protein
MLNTNISYFDNAKVTTGTEKTIKEIILNIQNETFKDKILQIRNETNKEKRTKLKSLLPAITASGVFIGGRKQENCTTHSGLIQIDFDNVQDLKEAQKTLKKNEYTFVMFLSPNGTGLKLFVKITPSIQEHKNIFLQLENYYKNNFNLEIDKSTKDISRLCYLSADKNLFLNENSKTFELTETPTEINLLPAQNTNPATTQNTNHNTTKKHTSKNVDFTHQDKRAEVERILNQINFDITQNYNDWLKIGFAFANEFGENGRDYFHKISAYYPKYNHQETETQYNNCLRANNGQTKINTFFEIAKNYHINISLSKNTHHTTTSTQEANTTQPHTAENEQPTTIKEKKIQELKNEYARIGTEYVFFEKDKIFQKWKKELLMDDFGEYFDFKKHIILSYIKKYKGFDIDPDNINYKRDLNGYYNLYEPLSHVPQAGNTQKTHDFLKHIFQNHYDIALDYLTILYQHPKQNLPILCLVSEDRSTGKTTFLNFLEVIFEHNVVSMNISDFEEPYNAHYVSKLIIGLEEGKVPKKSIEKIKHHTTSKKLQLKAKFLNNEQINNFGKIVICSNEVNDFANIDKKENRFFVNIVPKLTKENPNLLQELAKEKNAFVFELQNR